MDSGRGKPKDPFAVLTPLGWTILGPLGFSSQVQSYHILRPTSECTESCRKRMYVRDSMNAAAHHPQGLCKSVLRNPQHLDQRCADSAITESLQAYEVEEESSTVIRRVRNIVSAEEWKIPPGGAEHDNPGSSGRGLKPWRSLSRGLSLLVEDNVLRAGGRLRWTPILWCSKRPHR